MKNTHQYEHLYRPHDKSFTVNDLDPDRRTIRISLPEPPPLQLIDGYGLHPDQQVFRRKEVPESIMLLQKEVLKELQDIKKDNRQESITGYKIIELFWEKFDARVDELQEEAEYIKHIWWWRTYGYWCFIDGKPTYLPPKYFMLLNFYQAPGIKTKDHYLEYRDRHRREYLFRLHLKVAHHSFKNRDEKGWAIPEEDGSYQMIDIGLRLFYGDIHPKNRRNGSSVMGLSDVIEGSEAGTGKYSTIISKDGDSALEHYNLRLLPAWGNRPYFIRPLWSGSSMPTQIKYFPPNNNFDSEALMGIIEPTVSAGVTKKDGSFFNGFIVFDEEGKNEQSEVNVLQRWDVYKAAMSLADGADIVGECTHISTVEDINAAGKAFLDMLETSDYYQRGENGQTTSGLAAMFFPAYDGLQGFIDFFGQSVITTPTERQLRMRPEAEFAKYKKGSYQYQQEKRDDFLKKGTPAAMQSYRAYIKKFPWKSSELTIGTSGDLGFDYQILDTRIAELRKIKALGKTPTKIGNFYRHGNHPEGNVYWKTEENGKFEISMEIAPSQTNLKRRSMGWNVNQGKFVQQWEPVYKSRFTLGADPVEYSNKKEDTGASKQSDPAMTVKWEYDQTIDKSDNPEDWITDNCILYYRYRPQSLQEYCEDCLMAAEFIGAMIYPENNKTRLIEYIIDRGRGGYLKYDIDPRTGKIADKPGYYATVGSKSDGFGLLKDWVAYHAMKCDILRLLEEIRNIRTMDEMTKYDGLASWIAALKGGLSAYGKVVDRVSNTKVDLGSCSWLNY